jgi:signal transduction histidine kinase
MTPCPTIVLNVDDVDVQRYVKTRDLRDAGFDVIEARSGAEALRVVKESKPAIVLLDVQLPDINGYEVCAFVKENYPGVMVLMTSATFTTSAHRTHGLNAGADSYLVQPAEPLELAAAINALLRIRKSEEALRSLNETLEQRVRDRVADLAGANLKLEAEIAQRKKAEAALVQAQKMEAIGQLTGGLAHDFNNLLTAVVGNLDLIRARASEPRIARLADNAFKAAERGSKLTAQLLAFSRTQKLATTPVDINALIDGMRDLLSQSLGASVKVRTELAAGLPAAMADANQLELAILNLSLNSRDAMADGGTLTIATALDPTDGSKVTISVTDTGSGMTPEVLARAFDPFFTTKPPGKGTGLGLSQVYGIVRQTGGDVAIESAPGKGTAIRLSLPRTSAIAQSAQDEVRDAYERHSEKLLVVDDDPDVREIVTGVLSDIGYDVHEAADGDTALSALATINPDLLIIDFAMPGTNGAEIAQAALARNPGLRILFISGFSDSAALESAVGDAHLLRKPFRPGDLGVAVRSALDA